MKTIAIEDMIAATIDVFVENARRLGWDPPRHFDEWWQEMTDAEKRDVGEKVLKIIEEEAKRDG